MDTVIGTAVVEFFGGAADGLLVEHTYPLPTLLVQSGDSYRLYCSRPFAGERYAHYKLVRT